MLDVFSFVKKYNLIGMQSNFITSYGFIPYFADFPEKLQNEMRGILFIVKKFLGL